MENLDSKLRSRAHKRKRLGDSFGKVNPGVECIIEKVAVNKPG